MILMVQQPASTTHLPYTTLFRSAVAAPIGFSMQRVPDAVQLSAWATVLAQSFGEGEREAVWVRLIVERIGRSEEHTSELQSRQFLVCRLLFEKYNIATISLFIHF